MTGQKETANDSMIRLIAVMRAGDGVCVTAALAQTATDAPLVLFPLSAADKTLADSAAIAPEGV